VSAWVIDLRSFFAGLWGRIRGAFKGSDPLPVLTLEDRIEGSTYILSYIARKNLTLDDGFLRAMIIAQNKLANKQTLSIDEEYEFWKAYVATTRLIAPVTIDSIRTSGAYYKSPKWGVVRGRPGQLYRWFALGTLLLLLIAQIYWLIGTHVLAEIDRISTHINGAIVGLAIDRHIGDQRLIALEPAIANNASGQKNARRYCIGDSTKLDSDNMIVERVVVGQLLTESNEDLQKTGFDLEAKCIVGHLTSLFLEDDELFNWNNPKNPLEILWPSANVPNETHWNPQTLLSANDMGELEAENTFRYRSAKLKLEIISKYVLPMLYGLLGACAFVLRSVANEVKAETYTRVSDVAFGLRLMLGLVAGLSVGWFLQPTDVEHNILRSLSPLALAFVAGYSVELLFTAMDRIVGSFTTLAGPNEPTRSK
jgi:hypothetical protein